MYDSTFMRYLGSQIHRDEGSCLRLPGRKNGDLLFTGYRILVWEDGKVVEGDGQC